MIKVNLFTLRNLAELIVLATLAIAIPYFVFESSRPWHYLATAATFFISPGIIIGSFLHGDPHLSTRIDLYAGVQMQFFAMWLLYQIFKMRQPCLTQITRS
jgi:hypothetical protein